MVKIIFSMPEFLQSSIFIELSVSLFLIGLWGILAVRGNIITMLISIELMLFSCTISFIYLARMYDDIVCQVFALLILVVAASESAIGLALIVVYYRLKPIISVDSITNLKGLLKKYGISGRNYECSKFY